MRMLRTDQAPEAVGPYAQGVALPGGLVFVSGQIGLDPATGALVEGGVGAQTARVMANIAAILEKAGGGLGSLVKTTVFLTDIAQFGEMNAAYGRALGEHRPARATVQVCALPRGAAVEIDAVAFVPERSS